jgi:glycosyltransferase involved in cell wall biosynthesis
MTSIATAGAEVDVLFIDARGRDWKYLWGLVQTFRRAVFGHHDVVHATFGLTGFIASFQPLPLVVSFVGDDLLGTPDGRGGMTMTSRIGMRLSHFAARRADAIICMSEEMRLSLPRAVDRGRAHILGHGVDTTLFVPGDRLASRQRLGINAHDRLVIFPHTRKQAAVKRFDIAEAAIRQLRDMGTRAKLWVVNDVDPNLMPDYYRAADCLLLTSDHEGAPNVVKEAICCDIPVVSVDAGDARRWMELAPGCELVKRDPVSVARGIRVVLEGPGKVDGSRVRAAVDQRVVAGQLLEVYWEALGRRKQRTPPHSESHEKPR